jgi:PPOX class probable F420-dependent enzyme
MTMAKRTQLNAAEINFVQRMRSARLATADEQGTPTLVPICYAFDGTHFYTALDEKPKRVTGTHLRRVRNIEARPDVALLIDLYADDWSQLGYVLIQGHAELSDPGTERHQHALPLLRARYEQYHRMALEKAPVIVITPQQVISWGPALK